MNEMSYLFDSSALLGGIVATECADVTHAELVALGLAS